MDSSRLTRESRLGALLWGAAHALDFGGVLLAEDEWEGPEADARALGADWKAAITATNQELNVGKEGKAEE